jgi:hypothetical protein
MLDQCFRFCVDPLFPPTDWSVAKKSNRNDLLTDIKMELIFDEATEGKELKEQLKQKEDVIVEISDEDEDEDDEDEDDTAECSNPGIII